MKYMGSKRSMLNSNLGQILDEQLPHSERFVDLFAGSAAVSWHVAQHYRIPVVAVDIQEYARTLAGAVVSRTSETEEPHVIWDQWVQRAYERIASLASGWQCLAYQAMDWDASPRSFVTEVRDFCQTLNEPLARVYGGHYFSPAQALTLDALRATIPNDDYNRDLYIASLIVSAAECAASPGHTAQPFQPTPTATRFLFEAWRRDVWSYSKRAFLGLATKHANLEGCSYVEDALSFSHNLTNEDLVFVDPPYSGVQYSRFYHVLETIANGESFEPEGVGRYPSINLRPHSDFSQKSKSQIAFRELMQTISRQGAKCIVTYPNNECSNGLSGNDVSEILSENFKVQKLANASTFSTLGGNGRKRAARLKVDELVLVCSPR